MMYKKYIQNIIRMVSVKIPVTVLIWQIMWVCVLVITMGLIIYWYSVFYTLVKVNASSSEFQKEYRPITDKKALERVLRDYDVQ